MEGGLERPGRTPGVELGPGVESPLGVGVLDFSPGVPALSRWWGRHVSDYWMLLEIQSEH